jgi:hypothetical protein
MLKEAPVFDGDDRVDQVLRDLVECHNLALGTVLAAEQRGNQLRLQLVGAGALLAMPS